MLTTKAIPHLSIIRPLKGVNSFSGHHHPRPYGKELYNTGPFILKSQCREACVRYRPNMPNQAVKLIVAQDLLGGMYVVKNRALPYYWWFRISDDSPRYWLQSPRKHFKDPHVVHVPYRKCNMNIRYPMTIDLRVISMLLGLLINRCCALSIGPCQSRYINWVKYDSPLNTCRCSVLFSVSPYIYIESIFFCILNKRCPPLYVEVGLTCPNNCCITPQGNTSGYHMYAIPVYLENRILGLTLSPQAPSPQISRYMYIFLEVIP